jgi:hypothetical protein
VPPSSQPFTSLLVSCVFIACSPSTHNAPHLTHDCACLAVTRHRSHLNISACRCSVDCDAALAVSPDGSVLVVALSPHPPMETSPPDSLHFSSPSRHAAAAAVVATSASIASLFNPVLIVADPVTLAPLRRIVVPTLPRRGSAWLSSASMLPAALSLPVSSTGLVATITGSGVRTGGVGAKRGVDPYGERLYRGGRPGGDSEDDHAPWPVVRQVCFTADGAGFVIGTNDSRCVTRCTCQRLLRCHWPAMLRFPRGTIGCTPLCMLPSFRSSRHSPPHPRPRLKPSVTLPLLYPMPCRRGRCCRLIRYDVETMSVTREIRSVHSVGGITSMVASPNGKYLLTGGDDQSVKVRDTSDVACVAVLVAIAVAACLQPCRR